MSYRYVSNDGNAYIDDDDKTYRVVWGGYDDESARIVEAEKGGERGRFMQLNENVVIEGVSRFDFDEFYEKGDYIDIDHSDENHLNIIREDEFNRKYTNAVEIRAADPEKSPRPPESIAEKNAKKIVEKLREAGASEASYKMEKLDKYDFYISKLTDIYGVRQYLNDIESQRSAEVTAEFPNGLYMRVKTCDYPDLAIVSDSNVGGSRKKGTIDEIAVFGTYLNSIHAKKLKDLITDSVEKYFPDKLEAVKKSPLMSEMTESEASYRTTPSWDELVGYNGGMIVTDKDFMTYEETEDALKYGLLSEEMKVFFRDVENEKKEIAELKPKTQEEKVMAVMRCQNLSDKIKRMHDKVRNLETDNLDKSSSFLKNYECSKYRHGGHSAEALTSASMPVQEEVRDSLTEQKQTRMETPSSVPERGSDAYYDLVDEQRGYGYSEDEAEESVDYELEMMEENAAEYETVSCYAVASGSEILDYCTNDAVTAALETERKLSKEILEQLSRDTQGVTHDDIKDNFDRYSVKGLDSIQYLEDKEGHNDVLQVTYSKGRVYNAVSVDIPVSEINDLPSAVSAAAKYSQTQEEFENEMNIPYDEAYGKDGMSYAESTEMLGNVRYDNEITQEIIDEALPAADDEPEIEQPITGENRHSYSDHDDYDEENYDEENYDEEDYDEEALEDLGRYERYEEEYGLD